MSSSPRYPLPPVATPEERAWRDAGKRLAALARVCDTFPMAERASPTGKGFSPAYQRAISDRDRASFELTRARAEMVSAGLRRMGQV